MIAGGNCLNHSGILCEMHHFQARIKKDIYPIENAYEIISTLYNAGQ